MKKRFLLVVLVAFCVFAWTVLPCAATQTDLEQALKQTLIDSCFFERPADISEYQLTPEDLQKYFNELYFSGQLPWYTSTSFQYRFYKDTGIVTEFVPTTLYDGAVDKALYEQKVAEILNACVFEGMSEYQIALSIHDYLVESCQYDETLTKSTCYDLLIHGTAVCSGYATAYQDLLKRVGIESLFVSSSAMNHGWNLVEIDGEWYHVDVTWDDPVPDFYGYVQHDYFMLTDQEISSGKNPHYGWKSNVYCRDTRFTDAYWRDVDSRICFESAESCYLVRTFDKGNRIYKRNELTGEETLLYQSTASVVKIGGMAYRYNHQGLSLLNDRLYFSEADRLLSIHVDGSDVQVEMPFDIKAEKKWICGSFISDSTAYLLFVDMDGTLTKQTVSVGNESGHKHHYIKTGVILPTCREVGYSVYSCECGVSYRGDMVLPGAHDFQEVERKAASFYATGYSRRQCRVCGIETMQELEQVTLYDLYEENEIAVYLVCGAVFLLFSLKLLLLGAR